MKFLPAPQEQLVKLDHAVHEMSERELGGISGRSVSVQAAAAILGSTTDGESDVLDLIALADYLLNGKEE